MTLAILGIVSALVPVVFWWMQRRAKRRDDPIQQHRERYAQIDRDIIEGASKRATAHASDDLDELDRLQKRKSDSSGSTRDKS